MGGVWGRINKKDFDRLLKKVESLEQKEVDALMVKCIDDITEQFIESVKAKTPVVTGQLRGQWDEAKKNSKTVKTSRGYQRVLVNNKEYASYVEWGHMQTPGRYVHAIRKRLKKRWVEGRYMMSKTEAEMNLRVDKLIQSG